MLTRLPTGPNPYLTSVQPSLPSFPRASFPATTAPPPLIDMPVYLEYLQHRLRNAGGTIEQRRLCSFAEAGPATAIVNCTDLGASILVPDPGLRPVRGQHLIVTNPGLSEFFSEDTGPSPDLLCIYPHGDTVVLGGTAIDCWESAPATTKGRQASPPSG